MDRMAIIQGQKLLKQLLDFLFQKAIETLDRLPKIQGQKIVETTVTFFI